MRVWERGVCACAAQPGLVPREVLGADPSGTLVDQYDKQGCAQYTGWIVCTLYNKKFDLKSRVFLDYFVD